MRSALRRLTSALLGTIAVGATLGVAPSPAQANYACPSGLLCLYAGANFSGDIFLLDGPYNGCNDVPLPSYFRNRAQSIINNRPSGTVSTFWDNANATGLLGYQHAYATGRTWRTTRPRSGGTGISGSRRSGSADP
ncbi:peptidase inhibitor family I36 protein [Micromonospora sp. NPDC049359]|uniref:peptidase inhibitor family I36 protein n=1 Tax=Micromonospora sp. NPDC049359 TaxID=3364270 RepID=UPI0037A81B32